MTEQTVPVPIDLLRALEASIRGTAWDTVQIDAPPLGATVQALTDLIPSPPKVGDTLTAEQVGALPVGALVVDDQEDSWLVRPDGKVLYFADSDILKNRQYPKTVWEPYTLVYLPRD